MPARGLLERVKQLEGVVKDQKDLPLFCDLTNRLLRIDVGGKRGQILEFDSVEEAACRLEKVIDEHPAAAGSITVDDLTDLYSDSYELRQEIAEILGDRVIDSPMGKISRKGIPCLHFGDLKNQERANIRFWLLAGAIKAYFKTPGFSSRLKTRSFTEDDGIVLLVFLTLYAWDRIGEPEQITNDFYDLVLKVGQMV